MSAARSKETGIRISHATLERLRAARDAIVLATEEGRRADVPVASESINPKCNGLSYDQLINLLLDARDAHHERARAQRAKRRKSS